MSIWEPKAMTVREKLIQEIARVSKERFEVIFIFRYLRDNDFLLDFKACSRFLDRHFMHDFC